MWMQCARISWNAWSSWVVYWMIDSYLLSLLSGWLEYVYKRTLWAVSCTLISYIHVVIRVTFIPCMHVNLRLFLNILIFKTSHEKGDCWFKQRLLWKWGWFNTFKGEFKYVIEKEGIEWWQQIKGMATPICRWDRWGGQLVLCDKSPHLRHIIPELGILEDLDEGRLAHIQA